MNRRITSFYVETLILILVFVAVILTLTKIFGMSKKLSDETKLLTSAVTLTQNAAEAFSVSESDEKLFSLLDESGNASLENGTVSASYRADMSPDPDGVLCVIVERTVSEPAFSECVIRVIHSDTGAELYSVETAAIYTAARR